MASLITVEFWNRAIVGMLDLIGQVAVIVIPMMILMEFLKALKILDKISKGLAWTVRPFAMPPAAVFPLLVGLVFGLAYGAGLIIQAAKEGTLEKRDLYLISFFLVINHSAIEDTLLFVAVGARGVVLLTFRFIASIILTWAVAKFILPYKEKEASAGS